MTVLLEEKWDKVRNRVILPLWNGKFRSMYESLKLDYDDFESMAGLELSKAIKTYDESKANLYTFASKIITQKAYSELRDCGRDKRKMLHTAENIDDETHEACFVAKESDEQEISELSEMRVGNFVNSLNNNQLRVLILTLLDFDVKDIPHMLNVPSQMVQSVMHSLQDIDLSRLLYRRDFK